MGRKKIEVSDGSSPRMRGAQRRGLVYDDPPGSSPRMRGAPLDGVVVHVVVGIIPADAGSTNSLFRLSISP